MKEMPLDYYFEHDSSVQSCNSETWTEFYNYGFGKDIEIQELTLSPGNDHLVKVEFGKTGNMRIIEFDAGQLSKWVNATGKGVSDYIGYKASPKAYSFKMMNWFGDTLKIYQKRKSSTGNLTINGFMVIFKEA